MKVWVLLTAGCAFSVGILGGVLLMWLGQEPLVFAMATLLGSVAALPLLVSLVSAQADPRHQTAVMGLTSLGASVGACAVAVTSAVAFGVTGRTLFLGGVAGFFAVMAFLLRSRIVAAFAPQKKPI